MAQSPEDPPAIGFDESAEIHPDDVVWLTLDDGSLQSLVLLAEVELEGTSYGVVATRDQLDADLDGDMMVVALVAGPHGRHAAPVEDDAVVASLQRALRDLIDLSAEDEIAEA